MDNREEQETRKILRLFKSAMLKVGKIEKVSPISISASQYNSVCRGHDINYVKLEVLRTLGGFIYLRDNIFKELKKQDKKAKNKGHYKDIILATLKDFISEKHSIPSFNEFKKTCSIDVKGVYKNMQEVLTDLYKAYPFLETETLNESVYTVDYKEEIDDIIAKSNKFVITTAVVDKKVDEDFYNSIKNYSEKTGAVVLILPCQDVASRHAAFEWTLDPKLRELGHVLFSSKRINENLIIWDIKTSAKQIKPITGLNRMVQPLDSSIIIASPKQYLEYTPTRPYQIPHAVMTTGAITVDDYNSDFYMSHRLSKIAEIDHKLGAIVVDKIDSKRFQFRHVEASENKTFTDMGYEYFPDGTVKKLENTIMVLGDSHSSTDMEPLYQEVFKTIEDLNITEVVLHDIFNASSVSPHDIGKIAIQSAKAIRGISSIEKEAYVLKGYLENIGNHVDKVTVVKSNHDMHLDRYLIEGRFLYSPEDFYIGCHLATKVIEGEDPLKYLMTMWVGLDIDNIKWLGVDESYSRYGIELGQHGSWGANGAKGSKNTFDMCLGKCIVGHTHTASIARNVYTVGIACSKDQGYNKGFSSWTYTSAVVYENGTRQLINYIPSFDIN